MVIFHSYVSLPEGNFKERDMLKKCGVTRNLGELNHKFFWVMAAASRVMGAKSAS